MSSFLGTRITKHEVKEVEEELKAQRKDYDEYDLYVYYKTVLETEKKRKKRKTEKQKEKEKEKRKEKNKKNNKKKQNGEKEETEDDTDEEYNNEGFQPCHFLSSIYKKSEIKKKSISDYIDKEDNIYEDIIISPIFQKSENYLDENSFTFFNESVGYTLLRNCGYTDGIPLGVNINELQFLKKSITKGRYEKNVLDNKSDDFTLAEKKECESAESRKNSSSPIVGPQLPQLYEEIRKEFRKEIDECELKSSDVENAYVHILAHKNKIILDKLKEVKYYEKKIEELHKPKNNFEGAYYINNKNKDNINNNNNNNMNALLTSEHFLEKRKRYFNSRDDKEEIEKKKIVRNNNMYEPYVSDEEKTTMLHRGQKDKMFYKKENGYGSGSGSGSGDEDEDENGYDISNECAVYYKELSGSIKSVDSVESVEFVEQKEKNKNYFVVDDINTNEKKREMDMEIYTLFYNSMERKLDKEKENSHSWNYENSLLYYEYFKLKRGDAYSNKRKQDLLNLYVPQKTWVTFNNEESKTMTSEISELKRRIYFNNDFKKRNRFFFYCKANEENIGIQHILSTEECAEFNDLMGKLKLHENLYTKEIMEEGLNSNFHIQDYFFNKEVLKKLNIPIIIDGEDNDNENDNETLKKMIHVLPSVPPSLFSVIFDA